MAKAKDALDDMVEPLTLMASSVAGGGASSGSAFPPELVALLQRKLQKEMEKEEQGEQELRRLLQARSEAFRQEIDARQRAQAYCPHRKEDNKSRVGGQRLSDGTLLYLCQFCGKEWRGQELPPELAIPLDRIGG